MMTGTTEYRFRGKHSVQLCFAEQDNRVKVPNGTAAVSRWYAPQAKAGHWKIPGRQVRIRGNCNPFPKPVSQKTYGNGYLRLLRVMGGAFVAEKRLRHP